ncbi:MAG TPA: TonB-dependent receptor, partial [Gammaproteobacteria bacterium]|nr:TonB-dependent receptor [Gammaproteobacteria bacterium]
MALTLSATAPLVAQGQERVMPQVEVIGERSNLEHIPGSGAVLEEETLKASRVFTTNEALRKIPGVHARDEEGLGLRPNIGMRGLNPTRSTKVLLLEDGIPLAYAPYGDNASYYHPPIERFERIEVMKGAGQILFGPQTLGGVINYITPAPPREFGGSVSLTAGNRDYFNGRLRLGRSNMLLDIMRKQGDGARDNTGSVLDDFNYKAVVDLGSDQALTLRANYYQEDSTLTYSGLTEAEYQNLGARYNPFKNDTFDASRYGLSATHEVALGTDATLTTNVYGAAFYRDWWRQASTTTDGQCGAAFTTARNSGVAVNPDTCNSAQGRLRDYQTWGVEPRLALRHDAFGVPGELDAGVRMHFETQDRQQKNGASPTAREGTLAENNERETQAYSVFVQNRFLFGKLAIAPGLRVEHIRSERTNRLTGVLGEVNLTEWIPGLGATFNPDERTTYFAGVHRGFAPPRTEDLIGATGTFTDVDAEKSWNYELGVRTGAVEGVNAQLALFHNDFSNQIAVGSIAGGSTPLAQGETLYQGVELSARLDGGKLMKTTGNPFLQLAYTWLPTAESQTPFKQVSDGVSVSGSATGKRLPYAP